MKQDVWIEMAGDISRYARTTSERKIGPLRPSRLDLETVR